MHLGLRVYELAREIRKDSKYILLICHDLNLTDVENHMNVLTDEQEDRIREYMGAPPAVRSPETAKPKKKRPARPRKKAAPKKKAAKKKEEKKKEEKVKAEAVAEEPVKAATEKVEVEPVPESPVEEAPVAAEAPPVPDKPEEKPAESSRKPGEVTDADREAWRQKGREALEWQPKASITGSAAIGKIDLPTERPAPSPRFADTPSRGPSPPDGQSEIAKRAGKKGRRGGKKVFVPSKEAYGPRRGGRRRSSDRYRQRGGKSHAFSAPVERPSKVEVAFPVTVKSLSETTGIKAGELLKKMMELGTFATINDTLDNDVVELLGTAFEVEITVKEPRDLEKELLALRPEDNPEDLVTRAPVVVFLGHVDHGKTSLLDAIRKTRVTESEAGGITQHFSAYKVGNVVFLDTPGHEAFTEMRARGANVTDVAVLVVAADDGIMPQTEEAINHARAANVPIVVALNKIDKPEADSMRVKGQLAGVDLAPEEWGGKTIVSEVSAITGQGIPELLEMLALEAELLELKANPNKPAGGTVLEAELSEGRGIVANVLVQEGTLRRGDIILCGAGYGRVRDIRDDTGKTLDEAPPSTPIEIWGLNGIPDAGDKFFVVEDLAKARQIAAEKQRQVRQERLAKQHHVTLENLFTRIEEGKTKELLVILKADVQGSLEAITGSLLQQSTPEVKVRILHGGVGSVTESDVLLADASDAIILAFNVSTEDRARSLADECHIEVRFYDVIYQVISDVRQAMEGLLEPETREIVTGHAGVQQTFRISRFGTIAGCRITDGRIERTNNVRLLREGTVAYTGTIQSLRREKDDVREVREGFECGIKIQDFNDVKEGDVIEAFRIEKVARKLE